LWAGTFRTQPKVAVAERKRKSTQPCENSTFVSGGCPHRPTRASHFDHENEDNGKYEEGRNIRSAPFT
jgi:hypothetical protein